MNSATPSNAPVVAVDGPSASGKGTVAQKVAAALGFHFLDSGALYRLVALAALDRSVALDSVEALAQLARDLDARFEGAKIFLDGRDVTDAIRAEPVSAAASRVASLAAVREALLERQRAFRNPPGLVADGRDMGSVVFPDAALKIFLTAEPAERARRRYNQLMAKGMSASMSALLEEIRERDVRDSQRSAAPLLKCSDAIELDTTHMTVDEAVAQVLAWYNNKRASTAP
jgi:cytidylate kinase